ncbi:MAG: hypothetical protein KIH64_006290 [Mycobacterium sp.]|nr:hypothetical protein [Mycobacterium sp.]
MIGRLLAWPFKVAAWVLIVVAFVLACARDDTLKTWMEREFLP